MKSFYKALVGLSISLVMTTAQAWGEREQGVLQGLAGAWLLGRIMQNNESQPAQPPAIVQPPQTVYVYPDPPPAVYYRPPVCRHVPYYDQFGRLAYYRQVCR
jgi:hypothetical protein